MKLLLHDKIYRMEMLKLVSCDIKATSEENKRECRSVEDLVQILFKMLLEF